MPKCKCDWCRFAREKPITRRTDSPLEIGLDFVSTDDFFEGSSLLELALDNKKGRQYLNKVAHTYAEACPARLQERNTRAIKAWVALKVIRRDGDLTTKDMPRPLACAVAAYVASAFRGAKDEVALTWLWRFNGHKGDIRGALWSEYDQFIRQIITGRTTCA
jgi:hypothetical protein